MEKPKAPRDSDVEMVMRNHGNWRFTFWLWPYILIPSCVAALVAVFFFIILPPIRHWMGDVGVSFWLPAFLVWMFITSFCTIIWIFAGRHLLRAEYDLIMRKKAENGRVNEINAHKNSCKEVNKFKELTRVSSEKLELSAEQNAVEEPLLPDDQNLSSVVVQKDNFVARRDLNGYHQSEKSLLDEKLLQTSQSSGDGHLIIPESHSTRRVSYAGVISVDIPPREGSNADEQLHDSKPQHSRPPTPRFPRGMRVASSETFSAKYNEICKNQQQKSTSSEPVEVSEVFQFEKREDPEKNVEGHIEHIVLGNFSSSNSHPVDSKPLGSRENGVVPANSPTSEANIRERRENDVLDSVDFKKRTLSDEGKRSSIDRNKRMSMDRNQFLGWNPDEGVLAEIDPESKDREEKRWKRSIGGWRASMTTALTHEVPAGIESAEDDELDDVFQEKS